MPAPTCIEASNLERDGRRAALRPKYRLPSRTPRSSEQITQPSVTSGLFENRGNICDHVDTKTAEANPQATLVRAT
jgi:hypothetical protein